ncbi:MULTISPECIES: anthranilate synthase component II [Psychrobacter]|uniref:Aminodeoxychorismate/anthranilate synthase component II n=1 Tax=Psychrobacter communis TaxID=2762238 RepID=A0ABR8RGA8_9GAMM|nr:MULTISPECIES: aminodeoxychorismate/anthranilate synthase component II [Psychrobacter]MBD7946730.1 aminodeoxychorismate/anthranilate synthase component II [Psychrobacter communis]MBP8817100.1 aminodeoxychorismate/anthranilate synthase component II [Psychrobacter sp.]TSB24875.1 aminodeoxychorismate/anthranilate synthase component II [Psychrobacter sp. YGAH215]
MILMIDNYDSFTYNIVQYFGELQQDISVWHNDEISIDEIKALAPDAIVIGPGPCDPDSAGISLEVIATFKGIIPILGICLGHQAIGQAFGGKVVKASEVMHGRLSAIYHNGQGAFTNLPNPAQFTRYHSLVIEQASLPDCFEVSAWTQNADGNIEEIMGIRHREFAIEGVQFHPESILSEAGYQLLNNFLQMHQLAVLSSDNLPKVG